MFQLRIYTLRTPRALQQYAAVHWARHVVTFPCFGVHTHGVWTESDGDAHRLVALISFRRDADPGRITGEVMASAEFAADMAGFDADDIVAVQTMLLDPATCSPLH
ncbi:NIPSNAP protein [Mycobacterium sp. BK558]|uniref:NIPSNAP domain-containing protein n=1 Tax=Mycolicibacterium chlorophenolicum TaxID=37916 RepID=A0A0J6ZGT5_9MYCO|nr:NIPSNAP family protein [Mycolicibacterium chlorophenolicum]KMO84026.1 hypothetical protein MCHLDSM_00163 [Mycolicibacterium chlorophenolicum]RZT12523.1 NIPSNAP protein [Mycobacterium sp. BK558]